MPFAETTKDKVLGILGLPVVSPRWVEFVQGALDSAANYGGEATVTRIEGYVTKYEAEEVKLNAKSADAGLIEADVLKWERGGKLAGHVQEMSRYRNLILNSLFTKHERRAVMQESDLFGSNRVVIDRG